MVTGGRESPLVCTDIKVRAEARTSMVTRIVADHILQTASPRHNELKTRRGEKH